MRRFFDHYSFSFFLAAMMALAVTWANAHEQRTAEEQAELEAQKNAADERTQRLNQWRQESADFLEKAKPIVSLTRTTAIYRGGNWVGFITVTWHDAPGYAGRLKHFLVVGRIKGTAGWTAFYPKHAGPGSHNLFGMDLDRVYEVSVQAESPYGTVTANPVTVDFSRALESAQARQEKQEREDKARKAREAQAEKEAKEAQAKQAAEMAHRQAEQEARDKEAARQAEAARLAHEKSERERLAKMRYGDEQRAKIAQAQPSLNILRQTTYSTVLRIVPSPRAIGLDLRYQVVYSLPSDTGWNRAIGRAYSSGEVPRTILVQKLGERYDLSVYASSKYGGVHAAPLKMDFRPPPSPLDRLVVATENRCTPYDRREYSYPPSIEWEIVKRAGYVADRDGNLDRPFPSPYLEGVAFTSLKDSDIEHIVSLSEAHDSGLCAADAETKRAFARDYMNLTLATPHLNRHVKVHKDAAEWMPDINRCPYARQIVAVKGKYGLSVDRAEKEALAVALGLCGLSEAQQRAIRAIDAEIAFFKARNNSGALALLDRVRRSVLGKHGNPVTVAEAKRFQSGAGRPAGREMWRLVAEAL